ncbi:MAG: diacylglycerol kinase family lipid kinase [Verrucomicrobiae bacterium]|nr:diacylglycerol kinase family lipid kinase [Verrucomicrobiae bacterium]
MPRTFLVFNPAARGEKSERLRRLLQSKAVLETTLAQTERPGDATRLAKEAVAAGYEIVVAAGGDGTINEVVNGMGAHCNAALGVLPLGTANVLARELGIPLAIDQAWETLRRCQIRTIDLGVAEFGNKSRLFVQLAGVGLDARAVRSVSWRLKKQVGPISYVWAGLQALRQQKADVEVIAEDIRRSVSGAVVLIGNGQHYGGPFRLFPQALLDDGQLDVCVFERAGYLNACRYGLGILRGTHTKLHGVQYFRSAQLVCRSPTITPVELDGEDAGDTPVTFRVQPRALRVIVPP